MVKLYKFYQLVAIAGLLLSYESSSANPKSSSQSPSAVTGNATVKFVDFKDELNKIKKKLHKDNDKSSESGTSETAGVSNPKLTDNAAQSTCRPNADVAVEVTNEKCAQPYKSSDFATRFINKTPKHASVQIEFEAHSGGTGTVITRKQMFDFKGNSKETSYLCATKAHITKCEFD